MVAWVTAVGREGQVWGGWQCGEGYGATSGVFLALPPTQQYAIVLEVHVVHDHQAGVCCHQEEGQLAQRGAGVPEEEAGKGMGY